MKANFTMFKNINIILSQFDIDYYFKYKLYITIYDITENFVSLLNENFESIKKAFNVMRRPPLIFTEKDYRILNELSTIGKQSYILKKIIDKDKV
jgi:hypothetical protein